VWAAGIPAIGGECFAIEERIAAVAPRAGLAKKSTESSVAPSCANFRELVIADEPRVEPFASKRLRSCTSCKKNPHGHPFNISK